MADQDLLTAFNDCIDRLMSGQSMDDCLRLYPQHARTLRPMLEAGAAVRRARVGTTEIQEAQARVRQRVAQAARTYPPRRNIYWLGSAATLAASLLVVFFLLTGGAAVLSQNSLPSDPLYGIKRLTESVQLTFSGGSASLQAEFETRRVQETRQLLTLKRAADVNLKGGVSAITGTAWIVAGLPLNVPMNTLGAAGIRAGDRVEIEGYTTAQGELFAREITLIEPGQRELLPTLTPVPTRPILTFTATPQLPLPTPTLSATISPTSTPSRTPTPTPTATLTSTPSPTMTVTGCQPTQPAGWTAYTIQAGDTLSAIAAARGISLDELVRVNCITNTRLIVAGQQLYLPPGPDPVRLTAAPSQISVPVQPTSGDDNPPGQGEQPPSNDNTGNDNGDEDSSDNSNDNNDSSGGNDNNDDNSGHGGGNDND